MTDEILPLLLETVRRFVRHDLLPAEAEMEETGNVPIRIVAKLKELGFFGMTTPQRYGGLGLSMAEEVAVVFELGYAAPAFRSYFGTSNGVGTLGLLSHGTEEQRERYLPRIATGELIAAFCLTEPEAGSDAISIRTRATRDGNHYVINGTKRFVTNADRAGLYTVFARTEGHEREISAFLVERRSPGITVAPPDRMMGFRGAQCADVIFEDCVIPSESLIGGKPGGGMKMALGALDHARLHMSALAAGLSRRLVDEGGRYAATRVQFGQPIGHFQLIQGMLADCQAELLASRAMVEKVAAMKDHGETVTMETACCKYFTTEALGRIADRILQIHGGYGYVKDYPVERLYRDARLFRLYEGTSQIQQLVIARELMARFEA